MERAGAKGAKEEKRKKEEKDRPDRRQELQEVWAMPVAHMINDESFNNKLKSWGPLE